MNNNLNRSSSYANHVNNSQRSKNSTRNNRLSSGYGYNQHRSRTPNRRPTNFQQGSSANNSSTFFNNTYSHSQPQNLSIPSNSNQFYQYGNSTQSSQAINVSSLRNRVDFSTRNANRQF